MSHSPKSHIAKPKGPKGGDGDLCLFSNGLWCLMWMSLHSLRLSTHSRSVMLLPVLVLVFTGKLTLVQSLAQRCPTAVACDVKHVHYSSFPFQAGYVLSVKFTTFSAESIVQRVEKSCPYPQLFQWLHSRILCFTVMWMNVKQGDCYLTARTNKGKKKKTLFCLSWTPSHLVKKRPHKENCFPSADSPDDQSQRQDTVKNYKTDVWTEQQSREPVRSFHVPVSLKWWLTSCGLEKH